MTPPRLLRATLGHLLVFIVGALVSITLGVLVAAHFSGSLGISRPFIMMALASTVIAILVLALSVFLLRREAASIATLGLPTDRYRIRELAVGFIITAGLMLAVAYCQSVMVGGPWHFQGWMGVSAAGVALGLTGCMVLAEEFVFRGVGLRYLRAAVGDRTAIVVSALVFGGYHLIGSQNWGMGLVLQFITPTMGGLLFGWAAVRSGGLALPIGLHWGNNWVNQGIAGFSPIADLTAPQTLWRIPITADDFRLLMAPDVLSRLPYFAAIAISAVLTALFLTAMSKPRQGAFTRA